MISLSSIGAVVSRHMYILRRDPNFLLGVIYWPLLDILVWGFLGSWITKSQATEFYNYESVALLGILLWQIVGRGGIIIAFTLSEELWTHNLVNLFSLPLRIIDWIIGVILFCMIITCITVVVSLCAVYLLYDVSMWYLIHTFLIFSPPLFFSAIWLGFTCLQVIITLGRRSVELGFVIIWFFLPFSGAYYPIDVLPHWGKTMSLFLPMSYVFQGMRSYVMYNENPTIYLIKGYSLGFVYAACAILLFIYCFNRSKCKGLARLSRS